MRNFKRIITIAAMVCVFAMIVKGLDFLLYPCTFVRNNVHTMTTEEKDVLIFGTSNGMTNLDPTSMLLGRNMTGQNMCVGGEYAIDAYYLAKLAIEKQHPKTIIYEVDPGYFTTEKEKGNNYLLFYHEFPASLSKMEYFKAAMLDCDMRFPLFSLHEYSLSLEMSKMKDTVYQKWNHNYDVSYFKGEVQEYHESGFVEKYPLDESDFPSYTPVLFKKENVKESNMKYLTKLIQLCKDQGIDFIATSTPLSAQAIVEYQQNYNQAWDYFSQFFKEQGVPYYNFNREYYMNYGHDITNYADYAGHMNGDSARVFSVVFGQTVFDE